uniref:Uncharacterized protein n=1 Tax=Arundo donax TaxID=35708 RepID=A0A0A9AVW4_ARUDO
MKCNMIKTIQQRGFAKITLVRNLILHK